MRQSLLFSPSSSSDTDMSPLLFSSGANEWFTPSLYIEAARSVMGCIDLDPASCAQANETVQAMQYHTTLSDGLTHEWEGNCWVNPPYGKHPLHKKSNMSLFTKKLIDSFSSGSVTQAVLLVTAVPDRKWFAPLWSHPLCFPDHQIVFTMPNGSREHHPYGSVLVYFGPEERYPLFIQHFTSFGPVILPHGVYRSPISH